MTSQLKKIDQRGEILANQVKAGTITREKYTAELRKLVARAEAILARQS